MKQYHRLLEDILNLGEDVKDRTGVGTRSIFGYQMRFNLQEGFPAITTKKLTWKAVVGELLWMLEGSTDERRLAELTYGKPREVLVNKQTIWTANADNQGKALGYVNNDYEKQLGPVYGSQWRKFGPDTSMGERLEGYVDQISNIVHQIRTTPDSRRIILTAWNPMTISVMALPPCHYAAQFRVYGNKLSCMLIQRSGDTALGIPFNIASYSLLTHILARECNLEVGDFVHTIGDAHIYLNHMDQVEEQLLRKPYDLPTLHIDDDFSLEPLLTNSRYKFPLDTVDKFKLINYVHHPAIKMDMAV
jgi:thymidylate synthase